MRCFTHIEPSLSLGVFLLLFSAVLWLAVTVCVCCTRVLVDVAAAAIVLGSLTTTNRRAIMMRVCV